MELIAQRGQARRVRGPAQNSLGGIAREKLCRPEHQNRNQQESENAQENPTDDRAHDWTTWEARKQARSRAPTRAGVRSGRLKQGSHAPSVSNPGRLLPL